MSRKTLLERQEEMRNRAMQLRQLQKENRSLQPATAFLPQGNHDERRKCISCKRRMARQGTVFCSRCNVSDLENKLRSKLSGLPVPEFSTGEPMDEQVREDNTNDNTDIVTDIPDSDSTNHSDVNKEVTYTRTQVAAMLGIANTTLCRWERKGKIPQPRRTVHNNQCLYTEEIVAAAREYMNQSYIAPTPSSIPSSPMARLPYAAKKTVKLNRKLERAVATRIGSGRSFL